MVLVLLTIVNIYSQQVYIPAKSKNLTDKMYEKYMSNYVDARQKQNLYQESLALANLGADSRMVFNLLEKSVRLDSSKCFKILEYDEYYKKDGFKIVFIKKDLQKWKNVCAYCSSLNLPYEEYKNNKLIKHQQKIAKNYKIDSSKLKYDIIKILDTIIVNDQMYRGKPISQNPDLWHDQNRLDSLNLIKITRLIEENGFPSYLDVGLNHIMTIWLVFHHQNDYKTRLKYLPILKKAVLYHKLSKNLLNAYIDRTESKKDYFINKKKRSF